MNMLVMAPILLPLLGAAVTVGLGSSRTGQRVVSLVTLTTVTATTIVVAFRVDSDGPVAVQGGAWRAPIGISIVADRLAVVLLVTSLVTLLAVLVYAIGEGGAEREHVSFHPFYLILSSGVSYSFLTGDMFNLFVAFEVMLMASFALMTLGGGRQQVRAGTTYIVISLIGSTLFLAALAYVYGATGTVNMADLHYKIAELPDGVRSALAVTFVVVFGLKAAVFPLFSWLPDSYPTAPTAITAVFAGLLTKVGVYALIRTQTLLFPAASRPGTLLLVVAALTMAVGVLGALAQTDMKRLLSFHIVSQIGYMVMGLGLFTVAGIAGAVFFIVHQIVVKCSLFLVAGLIERRESSTELARLSGLARSRPFLAWLFFLPALSLAGIPPLSGFVGKLALVQAGLDARSYAVVGVSLVVSLLTLFSMTKIWSSAFWGPVDTDHSSEVAVEATDRGRVVMEAATVVLVVAALGIAAFAGPIYALAERAAADVINPVAYTTTVLGR